MSGLNNFEQSVDFSFWRNICEEFGTSRRYRRGEYFVHTGEVLKYCGWIKSGGFKHTLTDSDSNLKTVGFVFDGSVLANYSSCMHGQRMPTDIIALKDSEVLVVPTEFITERLDADPSLHLKLVQSLFNDAYNIILNGYRLSAYERYCRLIEHFPRIFDLVPLSEIASYLNISLRQLHRFRK